MGRFKDLFDFEKKRKTDENEDIDFFDYPKEAIPTEEGYCSDGQCPCPDTAIPRGSGFLFISKAAVDFLKAAKEDPNLLNRFGAPVPILVCKQAVTLRGLNPTVARADAEEWWNTGKVPLRATPSA